MRIVFLLLAVVSLVTACGPTPGDAGKATLQQVMADTIEPQSALVQDMTFELYDDNGELDPRRLSTSHWDVIEQAGKDLEKAGRTLARAETHRITAEGVALQGLRQTMMALPPKPANLQAPRRTSSLPRNFATRSNSTPPPSPSATPAPAATTSSGIGKASSAANASVAGPQFACAR